MLRYLLLFSLLYFSYFSHSAIYQTCTWSDQALTNRFISSNQEFLNENIQPDNYYSCSKTAYNQYNDLQSIADVLNVTEPFLTGPIPPICFLASAAKYSANYPPTNRTNQRYYHCNSIKDINPSISMTAENPDGDTRHLYLRPPCISKNYHISLVKTFNKMAYCFGLSERETRNLFAIINHESQFTPNAKSPTRARCAGQLTKPTIITLNAHILGERFPSFHIHQSITKRCPSLLKKTIPSDILCQNSHPCPHSHLQSGNQSKKELKLKEYPITCKLTSDLPQCFLYTFLNFKEAIMNFDQKFKAPNEFERQEIPDEFIEKYGVGLNPNEIITAKTDNNSNTGDGLLFITARSAYEEAQKHAHSPNNPMYNLNVKTVSLISEEDMEHFKFFSIQLAYNGGRTIIDSQVTNFLAFLKERIDQADCTSENNKYCNYRKQILNGNSLSLDPIKEDFENYLRQAKSSNSTSRMYPREETFIYPNKIQKSIDHFQNSNGLIRKHLETLSTRHLSTNSVSQEKAKQIKHTVNDIKNQCQINIL